MAGVTNQTITIKRGLDIPILGVPVQQVFDGDKVTQVALLGEEYVGLKPTMLVDVGDHVLKGQALFEDKKTPGVKFTAPASGVIKAVERGEKRVLQAVIIDCDEQQQAIEFAKYADLSALTRQQVVDNLVDSGLWTAMRTRPFSRVPQLDAEPAGIFVTAIDTNPLAADPRIMIAEYQSDFEAGLQVLSYLTQGKVYLCQDDQAPLISQDVAAKLSQVSIHHFNGVHPAGLVGTHIHFLLPASIERQVWHLNYQDVIAYGKLFLTGDLFTQRIVAFAGPNVLNPRLIRTQLGAKLSPIVEGQIKDTHSRVVSGNVLNGHTAEGVYDYLGRFHRQICVLTEDEKHELLPWVRKDKDKFSLTGIMMSGFSKTKKLFDFTTHAGGSARAMMAFGQLARVMPLDILPTLLIRDLVVRDTDEAQLLGALELDEEDLALCTFVCPGKYDFGKELRACLDIIEREG
ncbi:Na(+)-translocating NADH-quinone reductase subunit A [Shewanella aestuarii]|uniref:Na(+)-translocating NADH-quinone reductase subunit A n=1 Tax=Shewanella aestuarii TaxID=1028752 RepID=A0A6G9QM03_9GAMM|nr:Na(+)-translocating NADH-quinone reductase subunit A [Shewanella aestuarii]QIR15576.1 Na(+)-translocating NADH-quinone reductase subunit A [Shewanella aestuarii]